MRKALFLGLFIMFSIATVQAQKFNWGLKAGLNVSSLTGDIENTKSLAGFNAGLFSEIKVLKLLAIQPEVVYSTQGTAFDDFEGHSVESLKLDYINVPVLAKLYIFNLVYLEAGPQMGFLMNAKQGSADVKDTIEDTDLAIAAGLGVSFADKFRANGRVNFGTTDIDKSEDADVKSMTIQIGAAYIF
ncbi:MAG TPA: porin family protein [Flavobacterium sp.]|uniref:porin family protein n=1 Tax=Flavobacterium sp. TaxID=239 RepID=UPI002CC29B22|nr:porin family protein [Flavobacterium sp.]HSD13015.1 porin family protein [Flavobacterium sp.]